VVSVPVRQEELGLPLVGFDEQGEGLIFIGSRAQQGDRLWYFWKLFARSLVKRLVDASFNSRIHDAFRCDPYGGAGVEFPSKLLLWITAGGVLVLNQTR